MRRHIGRQAIVAALVFVSMAVVAHERAGAEDKHPQLLPGDRVLIGTVEEVRSGQARIDTGEVEPRYVPMGVRKDKGLPDLQKGNRVEITVNDQNLLVDVHELGESSHHLVVRGQIAEPLRTGSDKAVIRTKSGKEESHFVRPVARSKVASMPVGADAVFLIDELDRIVDVTFSSMEAVHRSAELWQKKTPLKNTFSRISGVIAEPLDRNMVAVRTEEGKEVSYTVRPLIQKQLQSLSKGDAVVLLLDEEIMVTDVAIPPGSHSPR